MIKPDVVIGGFGSSKYQVDQLADTMARYLNHDVIGVSLVDAMREVDDTLITIEHKNIATHSAGFMALASAIGGNQSVEVASVLAIAPPCTTDKGVLVSRSHRIVRNLALESLHMSGAFKSNILHAAYMAKEMHKNGLHHVGAIPRIAAFDSFKAARSIDAPVQLAIMDRDELFCYPDIDTRELAKDNVDVVEIRGTHPDFIRKPERILLELGYAACGFGENVISM